MFLANLLSSTTASGAVCPDDPEKHHFGAKVAPSAGVNLNVEASEAGDENEPFLSKAITVWLFPVFPVEAATHKHRSLIILVSYSLSRCLFLPCVLALGHHQTQQAPR